MTRRYLIVGNGPAGWAAGEAIRERDRQGAITIISAEGPDFYSRPGLAYLLTGAIPEKMLFARSDRDYRRLGIDRLAGTVVGINPERQHIHLQDGKSLRYDALLLATGAKAMRPAVPGIELGGVVTLDTFADARGILRLARRARRAVVIGGGITAIELAEGLVARGVETHYLMRKDRFWSSVLDEEESALVEARLEEEGIHLHRRTELARLHGRREGIESVETTSGTLKAEMLAVAIGIRPRLQLPQSAGLEVGRGILVDERMASSVEGIYAAGDVAEVFDPASGMTVLDSLWWIALEQGRIAGQNMAGALHRYRRPPPFNVTRIGGITTTILGAVGQGRESEDLQAIARGDSEGWRIQPDAMVVETGESFSRARLLLGEGLILGAVVMGDQSLSRPLQHLIGHKVDITPIRDRLLAEPPRMIGTVIDFWTEWGAGAGLASRAGELPSHGIGRSMRRDVGIA